MNSTYLTPKQKQVLDYLLEFKQTHGFSPSQQEIARNFGFKSLGTVQHYLVRLEELGLISKTWNARRGAQAVGVQKTSFELPLLGRVAAGRPIEAIEMQESLEVPSFMVKKGGEHFVLKVKGDSMMEEGILDGDYVVIRKQEDAKNGDTVVALIDNEATIKKFFRRRGHVELQPANESYEPILVDQDQEFRVEGILAGVIRRL